MIKKHNTGIRNFYLFVSHKKDGSTNVSYGLVSNDNLTMIEIIPKHGPITILKSRNNIIDDYINHKCNRGDWSQSGYDGNDINLLLSESEFETIVDILKKYF